MVYATCIEKFRDKQGRILGYKLQEVGSNKVMPVRPYELKDAIRQNKIKVNNLTLTSDNRLLENKAVAKQNKGNVIENVAKAMVYMETIVLGMGDSYTEIVENTTCDAGMNIEIEDYSMQELEKIQVRAYIKLLKDKSKIKRVITDYTEYLTEYNEDELLDSITCSGDTRDNNKLIHSINIFDSFLKKLLDTKIIEQQTYNEFHNIKIKTDNIDVELCGMAYKVAHTFFTFLNDEFFYRSNDSHTVGGIKYEEDDPEVKFGTYVMHASLKKTVTSGKLSYSVGFNRDAKGIRIDIARGLYKYSDRSTSYQYIKSFKTDSTDVKQISMAIANKLNELATKESDNQ